MDLFYFLSDCRTWICIPCGYGISPSQYTSHLTRFHADHPGLSSSKKARTLLSEKLLLKCPTDPNSPDFPLPSAGRLPLPHLPIYEGLSCPMCTYACTSELVLRNHIYGKHDVPKGAPGRQPKACRASNPQWKKVSCQRLFKQGPKCGYFIVAPPQGVAEGDEVRRCRRTGAMQQVLVE